MRHEKLNLKAASEQLCICSANIFTKRKLIVWSGIYSTFRVHLEYLYNIDAYPNVFFLFADSSYTWL